MSMYDFEEQWRIARGHESNGDIASARTVYDSILEFEPQRLYIRLRVSAFEESLGNYRAARLHALKAAETVRKSRWKDLAAVTLRLLTFDETELVYDLISGADWTDPEIIRNSAILSQHLWLTGHVADALDLIEIARRHAPDSHVLSYSKANALRYSGRMEEATAEYERCLQLAPNYAYAHWSLATHREANPPGARIERIRRAQGAFEEHAPEQAYLHYALFNEYDASGEIDLAWTSLRAGARLKRSELQYDAALEHEGFQALQDLTSVEFIGNGLVDRKHQEGTPIFIVGLPRTGTTLLERILGNHRDVMAGGELNDFNSALCLESNHFLGNALTPLSVERVKDLDFARVGCVYLDRTRAKYQGRHYLVDKNPLNFLYAGYIAKALPHAKIICLNRSPMDACLSNFKELFANDAYGYSYDLAETAEHYARFRRLADHWQRVMPEQFRMVDYESLVTDPLGTTEHVMNFCGLSFEPDCIDITTNDAPVSTASSSQVRQPINTRGVGAWRKYAKYLGPLESSLEQTFPSLR